MSKRNLMYAAGACVAAFLPLMLPSCAAKDATEVKSPDGAIAVNLGVKDGKVFYTVARDGQCVMDTSYLAIKTDKGDFGTDAVLKKTKTSSHSETWEQVWGEDREVLNKYNELVADFEGPDARKFSIVVRAFDDGFGLRYEIPEQDGLDEFVITDELTQFALPAEGKAWSLPWDCVFYEGVWTPSNVSQLDTVCSPLTIEMNDSLYLTIHEANLTDYASMNLHPTEGTRLETWLTPWSNGDKVRTHAGMKSPWRTVIIGKNPGDLITSRLMLNLNEPCAIEDTSWIEPGRYIGIWWGIHLNNWTWCQGPKHGATTENTKRYIDFAAEHGFSGVLVEGWNVGWDGDWAGNGEGFDMLKAYPDFDIEEVCRYAKEKGVRLIGHNETGGAATHYENQMDSAFAMYNRLGMNSVKTGYVNPLLDGKELHGSQYGVNHYRRVIESAAKHHIMIDNHEPVMPTGLQRTWPNLMTQEGVQGMEHNAWSKKGGNPPSHTCTLPFTRGLAGPMDYTPGIFGFDYVIVPGTRPLTTRAKQLAYSVVLYSPLQMSADIIENYEGKPEFAFLTQCPTTWEKTVVPEAKIGEYVTIARKDRKSDDWYVGSITDENAHNLDLKLDFLDKGAKYVAHIYADGEGADFETSPYPVAISDVEVTSESVLPLKLARGGGAAIRIEKVK